MKRRALLRHLRAHGCRLLREGARHSWWNNPSLNKRSAVPRHTDIDEDLARKICRDLGVPWIR
jgi:mRNA interferase HicA